MKNRLLLVTGLLFLLASCGDTIDGRAFAEPEVKRFHEKLKLGNFESIYEDASADFKGAIPKDKTLALFSAIERKLGPLQETKLINWNVNTHNLNTVVVLVQDSRFKEGQATETFTFRIENEKAQLLGYNISSLDMLIK
jgi:hypothetical protein